MTDSQSLLSQTRSALTALSRQYQHGAYRIIIDPEEKVSLWAIEGSPNAPFTVSFTYKGRVFNKVDDVPDLVLKVFINYVRKYAR